MPRRDKARFQGNPNVYSLFVQQIENPRYRAEREKKLERVRRAKAVMEENPDAQRKGKWPCCTQ